MNTEFHLNYYTTLDPELAKIYIKKAQLKLIELQGGKVEMDYQEELKRLQEGGNFWKPKVGQYKLKALTELEDADPFIKKREGQLDEVHDQSKIKILVDGEEKIWTFGKGKTPASTYGQLITLASKHANALTNVEFSVVVKNDGTKNDYTIVE